VDQLGSTSVGTEMQPNSCVLTIETDGSGAVDVNVRPMSELSAIQSSAVGGLECVLGGEGKVAEALATGEANKFSIAIVPSRRRSRASWVLNWASCLVVMHVSQFAVEQVS
jgi:hypothetical protein